MWTPFRDPRTAALKDRDIAKGRVLFDFKRYRWRFK